MWVRLRADMRRRASLMPFGVALGAVTGLVLAGILGLEAQLGSPPSPARVAVVARPAAEPAHPPFQPLAGLPVLTPPAFAAARVGIDRRVAAAGTAAADAVVSLLDGGREVGRVRADASGRWTLQAGLALAPGGHELGLAERAADAPADRPPTLSAAPMMLVVGAAADRHARAGGRGVRRAGRRD